MRPKFPDVDCRLATIPSCCHAAIPQNGCPHNTICYRQSANLKDWFTRFTTLVLGSGYVLWYSVPVQGVGSHDRTGQAEGNPWPHAVMP